ncbi:branched-chain amino acid transferase [Mesorhizobium sp. L-8-10]|uniref:aminotransferase class IV n=1 Tax=unclassified Mesorhizobium TaxID=325217 RepID=UPI0019277225|nr:MULTISPECIES: aminotransferase class IV [unclassified Mesorhizobium]BCH20439.1 branched-chain amino acid transferase [Mesorhizobium sp. L-8-3]BCH28293.1 branched-chain amino acid transferase [Mesorhizobium sp. L-8-10]
MTQDHDPADGIAFVDGAYVPLALASVPLIDRGFVRSDATYDVVHVWQGRFFRLDNHIERFHASMQGLHMSLPHSKADIAGILTECVRRSGLRDAYVQMTCTRGVPPRGTRDPRLCRNRFYAFAQPFVWIANEEQRREGLSMIVSSVQRIQPEAVDPRIKNFHWLDLTMGIFEAYENDAVVAVLTDRAGNVTEGAGFNVFAVRDGRLATPDRGVFEGMTRRTVIEMAREVGIGCEVRDVPADELRAADEIFITSTAGGIMPVTVLDGRIHGNGKPGPLTRRIHDLYWDRQHAAGLFTEIDYG